MDPLHSQIGPFGSKLADEFIKVRVGGDMALMNGVLPLIEWDAIDHNYVESHTENWSELVAEIRSKVLCERYLMSAKRRRCLEP